MRKSAILVVFIAALVVWALKPSDSDDSFPSAKSKTMSRAPAAAAGAKSPTQVKALDLLAEVEAFKAFASSEKLSEKNCTTALEAAFLDVYGLKPGAFDAKKLKKDAAAIQQALFDAMLSLRQRQRSLAPALEKNDECVRSFRNIYRAGRVLSETVGEFGLGYPAEDADEQPAILEGSSPYMYVNPAFGKLELKSGDVLMSRGSAFVSAAIARMAGLNSNASHAEIVYVDPAGKKWTIGAHIEVGAIVQPLESYLNDDKVRVVVFRHKDQALAAKAAEKIYKRVREYASENGENIPYDFKMDMSSSNELFCSELVASAYDEASGGKLKIPEFRSHLYMLNRDFLDRLGIKVDSTFMPADMELDTRFDLVAEWRDLGVVNRSHMKDAVLTAIYDWMEKHHYVLFETSAIDLKKVAAWHLRRWPIFSSFLKSSLPTNMSQELIGVIAALNQTSEALYDRLERENEARRASTGFWLTPLEMGEVLESYRKDDLKIYQTYQKTSGYDPLAKKPEFHLLFRPR